MAKYEIWNFGVEQRIPWEGGKSVMLAPDSGNYTDDKKLADHLAKFEMISVTKMRTDDRDSRATGIESGDSEFEAMRMQDLIKLASARRLGKMVGKTKTAIIDVLRRQKKGG